MKNYNVKENNNFNFFLSQFKSYWYLFVICLLLFIGLAYVYNTYATKQYLISSTMLLQQHPNAPDASSQFANGGVSSVLNITDNIKNEGDVLRSRNLMKEVVQNMHLNMQYFTGSGLSAVEIYDEAPFELKILKYKVDSLQKQEYVIDIIDANTINIVNDDEEVNSKLPFNKVISLPQYDLQIIRRPQVPLVPQQQFSARIVSEDDAVTALLANYDAEFTDKATTNIAFTLYYPNAKKGEVILQNLMARYLQDNINNKKQAIDSTINFINGRIGVVENELSGIEKKYQEFRSNNEITDIDEQSKVLVGDASENTNRYQQQQIQLSIINDLKRRLNDPTNKEVIPSSLSIQNTSFAAGLAQYNNLMTERERRKLSYTESNPVIQNIDQQIQVVRRNLLQSIDSYKKEMELSSSGLSSQNNTISNFIKKVPGKQRAIIDFARQQELKQQLYVYLLQKREETAMAKAADMPYSRIVDNAKSTKQPVKPIKSIIYVMSFFLGIVVPFGYINSKQLLGTKISSEADIEKQTDVTIIGKIGHNALSEKYLVDIASRSPVTESFRTLRTKLGNILDRQQSNVIMITSSVKGEGKTFLTYNLGSTLAMSGKSVVLVELDLRKPRLSGLLGIENTKLGFSNYVIDDLDVSSIIKPSKFSPNCFVISSGPVVANASELLLNDKLGDMISYLRTKFDYILIDSSPVGLVSDALVIQKHVDMTIYVCRHNYTDKNQIEIINDIKLKDNVDNIYVVINDVDFSKAGYFGYGYGLGYGD
ncbi:GumC family protein [Mucilaginibacter phyllosphaerae]|uniref:non-specific protein-tyrosine kinase n=1 Tax=Mucilaginibacter phyllosphaerae TaxID=1812349 RepID=A0A4Y8AAY0_9SPHI|nr:tyrosine-protein kinase [Mucilaginibacter phyllosphaerae]MBB3969691.1 capsular exopolysaccharide synthesis family protein [Mucilaginibacter phyllosphaerae]TEW65075.1 polysaccharide biosynthesis tyrosine autokinase [Mucilaginibacter phyllosphaerae]GGH18146.1 tyrosine protein kinase [Mucilaginibacter phyllosphaerae]